MRKIIIINDTFKDFKNIIEYYQKLTKIEIIKIKPKNKNIDTLNINKLIKKDTNQKILLSQNWQNLSTLEILNLIKNKKTTFIIWWPWWLYEDDLNNIDIKISFWKITISHILTLTILLEQLFRIKTIIDWKTYHY